MKDGLNPGMNQGMNPPPAAQGWQVQLQQRLGELDWAVDLRLPAQGVTAVLGPSGSGKTTLLRSLAGLNPGAQGQVVGPNVVWQTGQQPLTVGNHRHAAGYHCPPWQRRVGMVFQQPSLLPHLTVRNNLLFGWQRRGVDQGVGQTNALPPHWADTLQVLGLQGLNLDGPVHHLSGGEAQRVALARALLSQPDWLLLDEPLAALDAPRRAEVLTWLRRLRTQPAHATVPWVYVTHQWAEALALADHVVVLNQGRVQAQGPLNAVLSQLHPWPLGLPPDEAGVVWPVVATAAQSSGGPGHWQLGGGVQWHTVGFGSAGGAQHVAAGQGVRMRMLARDVRLAPLDEPIAGALLALVEQVLPPDQSPWPGAAWVRLRVCTHDHPLDSEHGPLLLAAVPQAQLSCLQGHGAELVGQTLQAQVMWATVDG